MSKSLILYSRPGCHLCEETWRMLHWLDLHEQVEEVFIDGDEDLVARYGIRIPVLYRSQTGDEIAWPFGPPDIQALLADDEGMKQAAEPTE